MDLNYLGLQMRNTGKSVFGLESEYACPLIVRVYMSPDEQLDENWFKQIVEMKMLSMPVHGGGTTDTPVDFKFVRRLQRRIQRKVSSGRQHRGAQTHRSLCFRPSVYLRNP